MRNIPLWFIVSVPCVIAGVRELVSQAGSRQETSLRLKRVSQVFFLMAFFLTALQLIVLGGSVWSVEPYPERAVRFFQEKKLSGRIISLYGWGGYLVWKLPNEKVFIDGRMPSWRRAKAPPGESQDVRREYIRFFESETLMKKIGERYDIRYVLIPSPSRLPAPSWWISLLLPQKSRETNPAFGLPAIYDDGTATIRVLRESD